MSSVSKAVLAIVVGSILTLPTSAESISGGKVTSVNAEGTSFTYAKKKSAGPLGSPRRPCFGSERRPAI